MPASKSSKKKPAARKSAGAGKPASRKTAPAARAPAAKKPAAKKAPAKKPAAKKPAAKQAPAKKPAAKKPAAKKAPAKKPAAKKPAPKKAPARKPAAKPASTPKAPAKKPAAKKPAAAKAPATKRPVAKRPSQAVKPLAIAPERPEPSFAFSGPLKGFKPYLPAPSEDYMSEGMLDHFRQILQTWKQELMEEVDRTVHHMKDEAANFPDPNDRATQESEFGLELRTRDRERKLLKKIEQALARIEEGTYGYCSETGEEIGLRRLEARPVATLTVEAQERRELAEKQYRDRDDR
jgi:DnaK suppressor protein